MLATIDTKDVHIEFKTSKDIKSLLQDDANALNIDLSSCLISTATQHDKDVMLEEKVLIFSKERENFEKELAHPKLATKKLKELMNIYKILESIDE